MIFVDIANVFYKVIRQSVFPTHTDLRSLEALFKTLGLDDTALTDFITFFHDENAFERASVPNHLQEIVQGGLSMTWFTINNSRLLTMTRKGSRPGDCYADLVFSFAFTRLVAKIQQDLRLLGLEQTIYWSGGKELCSSSKMASSDSIGPIWADDLAIILRHPSSSFLAERLPEAAGHVVDRLALGGMAPNMGQGKTEIMAAWRNKGSFAIRRQIAADGHVLHTASKLVTQPLRFTGCYKHLGTWITCDLNPLKEFRSRLGQAYATITQHKTAIFSNRALPLSTKVLLFDCLVASGLFYNSATWMPMSDRHMKVFTQGVVKLFRRVAILHFGICARDFPERILLLRLGVLHPSVYLSCERLRFLGQLLTSGGDDVWAAIQQFDLWGSLIATDVQWLQNQRRHPLPFGVLREDWSSWSHYILRVPSGGRLWSTRPESMHLHSRTCTHSGLCGA